MIRITDAQYAEIAADVLSFVQRSDIERFFNYRFGQGRSLLLSAIVHRDENHSVEQIVPLRWEYKTIERIMSPDDQPRLELYQDVEVSNDFQWSELYKHFGFV